LIAFVFSHHQGEDAKDRAYRAKEELKTPKDDEK
jgi:hypothetical protein